MLLKKILVISVLFFVVSCNCGVPLRVSTIQRSDKKLACKDIILEINEAEHYREQARSSKGVGLDEALMPTCWLTGYVDGEQAIKSANARIDYLGHIYDLLECGSSNPKPQNLPIIKPSLTPKPSLNIDPKLHEHINDKGDKYQHSHPFSGPHRHIDKSVP